jgi:hypothetical protein
MQDSVKLGLILLNLRYQVNVFVSAASNLIERLHLTLDWLGYEPALTSLGSNKWLLIINKEKL